jgi:hypothetical protein
MKLSLAMEKSFLPGVWEAYKRHRLLSPPELLEQAAIECFLHPEEKEAGVAETIRHGLLHLRLTGFMLKD